MNIWKRGYRWINADVETVKEPGRCYLPRDLRVSRSPDRSRRPFENRVACRRETVILPRYLGSRQWRVVQQMIDGRVASPQRDKNQTRLLNVRIILMVVRLCANFEEYLNSWLAIRIFFTLNIFYHRSWKDTDTLAKLNYDMIGDINFLRFHVTRNAIFILIGNLGANNLES